MIMIIMLKKISLFTGISALNALIGLSVVMYLTHVLPPSEYAYLGIYGTLIFFLDPALTFNSISLVSINIVDLEDEKYQEFANHFFNFVFIVVTVTIVFGLLVIPLLGLKVDYIKLVVFALLTSLLNAFINMHYHELIYTSHVKAFGFYKIFFAIFNAAGTIAFIHFIGEHWESRLYALIIGGTLTLIIMIFSTGKSFRLFKPKLNFDKNVFLSFGAPLMIGLGAAWISTQSDKYIVLYYFNKETLGFYSFGSSLGMAFYMVNHSIVNAISPKVYEGLKNRQARELINKYFAFSCGFIFIVIVLAEIVLQYAGHILFGEEYIKSIPIVQLILISIFFNGAYRVYEMVLGYFKENTKKTIISYTVATVNIIVSLALIPSIGIYGPIVGTIFAGFCNFILYYFYAKKVLNHFEIN